MRISLTYIGLAVIVALLFYYEVPNDFLAKFADFFRRIGASIGYRF